MKCLGTGSIEEVMSRQSPEEGTAFTPRQGGSAFQGDARRLQGRQRRVTSAPCAGEGAAGLGAFMRVHSVFLGKLDYVTHWFN